MRRALAAFAITALALTGCGGPEDDDTDAPATSAESPASEPSPSPSHDMSDDHDMDDDKDDGEKDAIEIEIEGDQVKPNGKRVDVEVDKPIRLEIDSDRAGELHVHSSPEQEIAFKRGDSVVRLTVDTPGIVDVEEHEAGVVILQLEVR